MIKSFCFGGRRSAEFGMMITGAGTYDAPERDLETISIEGRNGDLIIDRGRYKNIPVRYPVSICRDFPEKARAARAWLLKGGGYRRLEDDYDPEYFRMGMFRGPLNFDVKFLNRAAEATLEFNCKPQRFLKVGEHPIVFAAAGVLHNPTGFPALPIITVYGDGSGTLMVGGVLVDLTVAGHLILDCETQNAYAITDAGVPVNLNSKIAAPVFPVLDEGETQIGWSVDTGQIQRIEIIPRWWTI